MKKLFTAAIVLTMCLVLAGCSSKGNVLNGYQSGDVTLGQYKGITYTPEAATEVQEADVESRIYSLLSEHQVEVPVTDRDIVEIGDFANIDYIGTLDGVAFEGGTAQGASLQIGSNQFIEGFEGGLIGHTVGETVELNLTFPDPYDNNPDLAGKDVVFMVKINSLSVKVNPELTDEFIAENTDYDTIEQYKSYIRSELQADIDEDADAYKRYQVTKKIIENTTFNKDLSDRINESYTNMINNYNSQFESSYGVDAATVYNAFYGMTEEQYYEYILSQAKISVQYSYILSAVAEAEGITVASNEIETLKSEVMIDYGLNNESELRTLLETNYGGTMDEVLEAQEILNKAEELIFEYAVAE